MAVVLEIEVSEPFDCAGWDHADVRPGAGRPRARRDAPRRRALDAAAEQVRQPADRRALRRRPDRRADQRRATRQSAGSFWSAQTCTGPLHDNTIFQPDAGDRRRAVDAGSELLGLPSGTAPAYPPAPHCNTRGLTALGAHVVERMMDLPHDRQPRPHEPGGGRRHARRCSRRASYSGVISPHGWMDPGNWPRLWKLGGVAFPGHSARRRLRQGLAASTARARRRTRSAGATAPTSAASRTSPTPTPAARSPTRSRAIDGKVTFDRQKTGDRTFDYTKDGVATLRAVRRLVRRPAPPRRQAAGHRHVERRRGLPGDVGARRRRADAAAAARRSARCAAGGLRRAAAGRELEDAAAHAPASRSSARARGAGACAAARTRARPTSPS